ncbi:MAG: histidine--tRNA ligase [Bacteroidetes bacterium]|nr:MAG: histidine--tRNA ligase [Bacteroidota bacterium]
MAQKPSIPRGTRDFSSTEMLRRNHIFDTIRRIFSLYGYLPIETPAMENLTTLLGKYGEEGDRLIFRILNSGNFLAEVPSQALAAADTPAVIQQISEKGLRYDLTVPFARYVVQHRDEIVFPFRRYQIQPVWRADKPQKGRYREFFQCDVDVIGSDSLLNEAELVMIIDRIFSELGINIVIKINNRKILAGIAEIAGAGERITDITVAIDKLEKIGPEGVRQELLQRGIEPEVTARLEPILNLKGSTDEKLGELRSAMAGSAAGLKGIEEMEELTGYMAMQPARATIELDLSLARGLNYYTGTIIEVKAADLPFGSICGGGRYDDLTGIFGMPGVSGVGVSFGADRIYDVMLQLSLFPEQTGSSTEVLIINFGGDELPALMKMASTLREEGIPTELFPEPVKLKKQFSYADSRRIPMVVIAGSNELAAGQATVKNMKTGEQTALPLSALPAFIREGKIS